MKRAQYKNETGLLYPMRSLKLGFSKYSYHCHIHPETEELFTGMTYEYFVTVHGWASIKYLPFKNGLWDGVEISMKEDGTILRETHWKENQFHGPNDWYYFNGRPQEKAIYEMTPSKKSRLLKIDVWHPNELKCTKSWIDSCGNGERRLYQENGLLSHIVFYDHFEYRTEILCDEHGKLDEVWAHRGIKREKSIWKVM